MMLDKLKILQNVFMRHMKRSLKIIEPQCKMFAFWGMVNFTLLAFIDKYYNAHYSIFHWLGLSLCTALFFIDYLPERYARYKIYTWYIIVFYCLPFFSSLMLFYTYASATAILNFGTSLVLLFIIMDWFSFILLFLFGALLSLVTHVMLMHSYVSADYYMRGILFLSKYYMITLLFVWTLFVAMLFSRNIAKNREKLELMRQLYVMQIMSGSMAHELRTPLLTILASIKGVDRFLPKLIEEYEQKDYGELKTSKIETRYLNALKATSSNAISEIHGANMLINMSLIKFNETRINTEELELCSIKSCVDDALQRYHYKTLSDKQLVCCNVVDDFEFKGTSLLVVHIMFNLLKNALTSIKEAGKGEISIWTEIDKRHNHLHFKDTGLGIEPKILPYVFDKFFSDTAEGTGIGLAFCKTVMTRFGGSIHCVSELGNFTEFVLTFPK